MLDVTPRLAGSSRSRLPLLRSRNVLFGALALIFILVIVVGVSGKSTAPQSLQIAGYVGHLGEWELTATLSRDVAGGVRELSGPLSMKRHIVLAIPRREGIAYACALPVARQVGVQRALEPIGHARNIRVGFFHDARASCCANRCCEPVSTPEGMKHTGLCSQDGPEEKAGEMRMRLSRLSASVEARLLIDGVECTYSGTMSSSNRGKMVCPDRRSVPLTLWAE